MSEDENAMLLFMAQYYKGFSLNPFHAGFHYRIFPFCSHDAVYHSFSTIIAVFTERF
jgi:hypothetical protein